MTYTIPVVTRLHDCGDGGYTMYVYNNPDELLADHPLANEYGFVNGKYTNTKKALSQEIKDKILNEDDPYRNGYIDEDTIKVEVVDGVARLVGKLSFHSGQ